MFFAIRRTILVCIYLSLAAMGFYLWTQRAVLEPAFIWVRAWQNRDDKAVEAMPQLTGQVTQVRGMDRIQVAASDGILWNVGLTGVTSKKEPNPLARRETEKKCREYLESLLISNQVRVELTYTNEHRALGLVHVGDTNVNAAMIASGLGKLRPQFIRFLPVDKQYPLLMADRLAQERLAAIAQAQNGQK